MNTPHARKPLSYRKAVGRRVSDSKHYTPIDRSKRNDPKHYNLYLCALDKEQDMGKIFFDRMFLLRNRAGVSREELARRMGQQGSTFTVHYISLLEQNKRESHKLIVYLMFATYWDIPFEDAIKPLTAEETTELNMYKERNRAGIIKRMGNNIRHTKKAA